MNKKLILIADAGNAKLFEASGLKVKNIIKEFSHDLKNIKKDPVHNGMNQKMSNPSHFFDPLENVKNDERHQFAEEICKYLKTFYKQNNYEEIIICAEPKMLGEIRKIINHFSEINISKEINKDLTHSNMEDIQKIVFAY